MVCDAVLNIRDFKEKYGVKGLTLIVGEFIGRAPDFPGAMELAEQLGYMMADLESALKYEGKI